MMHVKKYFFPTLLDQQALDGKTRRAKERKILSVGVHRRNVKKKKKQRMRAGGHYASMSTSIESTG